MTTSVAVVDHRFADLEIERRILADAGLEMIDAGRGERGAMLSLCAGAAGLLLGPRLRIDEEALSTLVRCRAIVRYGVGTDNVDVAAAVRRGIVVANVPDYCAEEVATHALAMILAIDRRLFALDRSVREGRWELGTGTGIRRLSECTIGIIGFGRIGEALGGRAAGLGLRVLVVDPLRSSTDIEAAGATRSTLETLLHESDFISIHAPKLAGAPPIIGSSEIAAMKRGAVLINVSRGGLVDEGALAEALATGQLGAAAIDVTEPEPPARDGPLFTAPDLILTPHAAWYSTAAAAELRQKAAQEVARMLTGGAALHPVTE